MDSKFVRPTRKDVAKLAGVSETVVSYVINNNRYVAQDKRVRVQEAIKKLNYRPNSIARTLKGKSSNHIVFIADQIVTEHFSLLISELDECAYDKGYMVSLCSNRNTEEFVREIIGRCCDGIIISSISFTKRFIQMFIDANIPVVLLENRDYSEIHGAGRINNGLYEGSRECVRYLGSLGRKNILYIDRYSARGHFSDMNDLRYRGFVHQMEESGYSSNPLERVITGCESVEALKQSVRDYLESGEKVDAFFGRNDKVACIAMQAAQEAGYRIPEDIAVIGFDSSTLGQYVMPTLTSVEIRRPEIARTAVDMLQEMIEQHKIPDPVHVSTKIIYRKSTDI